jgi:hypothetical protein
MEPIIFSTAGDPASVVATAGRQLASLGYTVTAGPDGWSGEAEVGSKVGRAIGGGFVRRMKVTYAVTQGHEPNQWILNITPGMTGASGGAIGMSKAKKEMKSIADSVGGALTQLGHLPPPGGSW